MKRKIGLWIVLIVSLLVAAGAAGMILWEMVLVPQQNQALQTEIQQAAKPKAGKQEKGYDPIDFSVLQKINPDIIGWITIPNTVIDYPVLQSSKDDPEHYLYRDYKDNDNKYGSVFLNANVTPASRSLTLYGHHMNDGQMFADILKYADLDFYKKTPTFRFDTITSTGIWKVFSVFKTNTDPSQGELFGYVRDSFGSDEDFLDFVYQTRIRSIINTDVDVREDDQLVVLSTCSYEFDDFRTVVVARKVRPDESTNVNTKEASYNTAPLYPDCWYWNGGQKPSYPNFEDAMDAGIIEWYSGDKGENKNEYATGTQTKIRKNGTGSDA